VVAGAERQYKQIVSEWYHKRRRINDAQRQQSQSASAKQRPGDNVNDRFHAIFPRRLDDVTPLQVKDRPLESLATLARPTIIDPSARK
jgi:hypothetical protein